MKEGTAIVITSGKGGTGKTSLTAGLGACLAAMGYRTLCLDADVGLRNLDLYLGLSDRAVMDFSDVLHGYCPLSDAVVSHGTLPNLFLLAAPVHLPPERIDRSAMGRMLAEIRQQFDFCLIDSPAGLGAGFSLAAAYADRAILVTTGDNSSLRDAQRTAQELRRLGLSNRIRMVMNRVRPQVMRRLRTTIDDAMDSAGLPLLGLVPEDEDVTLAINRGQALILCTQTGAAAAYVNIARRLTGLRVPLMKIR